MSYFEVAGSIQVILLHSKLATLWELFTPNVPRQNTSPDSNFPWTGSCSFFPTYSQGFSDVQEPKVPSALPAGWMDTYPFTKLSAYRNLIILRILILFKNFLLNTLWDQKLLDNEGQIQWLSMPWFPGKSD